MKTLDQIIKRKRRLILIRNIIVGTIIWALTLFCLFALLNSFILYKRPNSILYAVVPVTSGSMSKTIRVGDAILIKKQSHYEIGDVITFINPDNVSFTTHELVDIDEWGNYITKGNANTSVDPLPLNPDNVIGKQVSPALRYLGRFLMIMKRIHTVFFIIAIWIIYLISTLYDLHKFNKELPMDESMISKIAEKTERREQKLTKKLKKRNRGKENMKEVFVLDEDF